MQANANDNATKASLKFTKQSFMGIELDILVGHPEHDILFLATQVARAAGLKDPKGAINKARRLGNLGVSLTDVLVAEKATCGLPVDEQGRCIRSTTILFTEAETYQMLLRGHAPASEPFRKWVTEEVLPSIRKTGAYNVNESTTVEGQQFAGEFAALHAEVAGLKAMVQQLLDREPLSGPVVATKSPYDRTTPVSICDDTTFSVTEALRQAEVLGLGAVFARDKLGAVKLEMEAKLMRLWKNEDARALECFFSKSQKRNWTEWPSAWLKTKLDPMFYREAFRKVAAQHLTSV